MANTRKLKFGLIYGLTSGLIFAIFALGVNAFLLSRAHIAHPWLAFVPGLLLALLVCGIAGAFTMWVENGLLASAAWLIAGILMGMIAVWMPLWIAPSMLSILEPGLKGWPLFSWLEAFSYYTTTIEFVTCLAFLIIGFLETVLIEQAAFSVYKSALIVPIIICSLASGITGNVADNLVNKRFRDPAIALDSLFTFTIDNQGKSIDPEYARRIHFATVKPIETIINKDRRMFYLAFNETADQGKILVDFGGRWAVCEIIQNEPLFCGQAEKPSL